MGNTDTIKLLVTYLTAAALAVGGVVIAAWAWAQPIDSANPRDLALIYGLLGTVIGGSTAFLFGSEQATRASRASEKAHEQGVYAGLSTPGSLTRPDPVEHEFTGDPEDGDLAEPDPTPIR